MFEIEKTKKRRRSMILQEHTHDVHVFTDDLGDSGGGGVCGVRVRINKVFSLT